MHSAIPLASPPAGYPAFPAFEWGSSAVSPEAKEIRVATRELVSAGERSQALFADKAAVLSQLVTLEIECSAEGWDGNGANPIDVVAVHQVKRFLRALPDRAPLPEIAVEPDGSVSLDWIHSRNQLFSVSVGRSARLAFAWVDGADSGYGVARFDGQSIPQRIMQGIEATVGTGNAAVGAP